MRSCVLSPGIKSHVSMNKVFYSQYKGIFISYCYKYAMNFKINSSENTMNFRRAIVLYIYR